MSMRAVDPMLDLIGLKVSIALQKINKICFGKHIFFFFFSEHSLFTCIPQTLAAMFTYSLNVGECSMTISIIPTTF